MKVKADCIPCYLNQCLNAMDKGGIPAEGRSELLLKLLPDIAGLDRQLTPAENSTLVLHRLVELMGGHDPFAKAKRDSNNEALLHLPKLREMVNRAEDPLRQAIKFSVAGNVVDLGIFDDYDLDKAIEDVVNSEFKTDDYPEFREKFDSAEKVMIIGDNSGEIVFDRLLAESLRNLGKDVIYSVKGSFILNDATWQDVREAGIDSVCRVIDNGNNFLGTIEKRCSSEFLEELAASQLVISKGQANYESLEGTELGGDRIFFLLKAKCPVVAENLGVSYGDIVFMRNRLHRAGS